MARLTTSARNALPASDFAGPHRSYPIEDKAHQVAAKRLVGRGVAAGNISSSTATKIKAKATKRMGGKSPTAAKIGAQMMEAY